ncbi:hypothetical protein SH1V18_30760 [Vallitalea longa]|uniref:Copper amine oxidase-like N-terminal domain-containing protein n=1 Tax=Vallitalea longa TaxID=2936439 RepID=A0A9W5YDF8_9FIRM|nr:copper amine oxidase N-terminal domain-containing protein [Vallitalea longa]GKX30596.1 hypothetical protein SH1V18_30760 [Vallitalea longa]
MRKSIKAIVSLVLIFALSTSLSASSLIRDITGKENKGITVKYNNQVQNLKDGNGNPVYPVIINGSTYLPVRAIADMLGADITWEGNTKTIYITGNGAKKDVDGAVPTDLPSTGNSSSSNANKQETSKSQNNTSSSNQFTATSNTGTFEDPINLGTAYSYNYNTGYGNNIANADYTVTIKNVEPITRDDIQDLGFVRPDENAIIDYAMITIKVDVTNATYQGDEDYYFLSMYEPRIFNIKTTEGNGMVSDMDFGFNGCLSNAIDKATRSSENKMMVVHENESKSYSAEGNVIVGVYKNSKNLLSIKNGEDYDDLAYFKLY